MTEVFNSPEIFKVEGNYRVEIMPQVNEGLIDEIKAIYFSDEDPLHEFRRRSLKNFVFADEEELDAALRDKRLEKVVIRDEEENPLAVMMVTQDGNALSSYTPSHLYRVNNDGVLPFFHGANGWPGHYALLRHTPTEEVDRHNQMLKRQTVTLPIQIPTVTLLDAAGQQEAEEIIDRGDLWTMVDMVTIEEVDAGKVHAAFLEGMRQLNQKRAGLLLHSFREGEAQIPESLANIDPFDRVDNQIYWSIKLRRPDSKVTSENSAIELEEGKKLEAYQLIQEELSAEEKAELAEALAAIEHKVCQPAEYKDRRSDKLRHRPYEMASVIDQELPLEAFELMLNSSSDQIGLYTFRQVHPDGKVEHHGYFCVVTPKGADNPEIFEMITSQNPNVPEEGTDYIRIAALVADKFAQRYITAKTFAKWLNLPCKSYLPNGGEVIGDTDANLLNLRLVLMLIYREKFERWPTTSKLKKLDSMISVARDFSFLAQHVLHALVRATGNEPLNDKADLQNQRFDLIKF